MWNIGQRRYNILGFHLPNWQLYYVSGVKKNAYIKNLWDCERSENQFFYKTFFDRFFLYIKREEEEGMTEIENSLKQQHKTPFGVEYCKMVYEEGLKMIQETSLCGFWMPLKVKIKDVIIWWNDNWR